VHPYDGDVSVDVSGPVTLSQLEDASWQAADLFRNKVSTQKDYILALLFSERDSDLDKEEMDAALRSSVTSREPRSSPETFACPRPAGGACQERR